MERRLAFIFSLCVFFHPVFSQKNNPKIYSNTISLNADLPIGYFSNTHSAGIGINYSWSHRRFGKMNSPPENLFAIILNSGADYFFGKKDSYDVKYGGYTYFHLYGGGIFNPSGKVNISLTAGPMLRIYKSDSQIGIGANLTGEYWVGNRIAIAPAITITKEKDADPFYIGSLQVAFAF